MRHSWRGLHVRRLGRIGIGLVAFVVGLAAFAAATIINSLISTTRFWHTCGGAGFLTAIAVFRLCDKLGLVPDDSDPPTMLALSGASRSETPDPRSQG
jgi:hypothetical protein